jgi:hypothetical protein
MTKKQIRKYLGHSLPECRVRIHHNGDISRYGSTDPFDRSADFWHLVVTVADVEKEVAYAEAQRLESRQFQAGWGSGE